MNTQASHALLYAASTIWLVVGVIMWTDGHTGWMIIAFAVSATLWLIAADAMEKLP